MGRIRAIEFHQWRGQVWKFLLEFGHAQCGWCHGSNDGRRGDRGARRVGDDHLVMRNPQDADHLGPLKVWAMDYTRTLFLVSPNKHCHSCGTSMLVLLCIDTAFCFVLFPLHGFFCWYFFVCSDCNENCCFDPTCGRHTSCRIDARSERCRCSKQEIRMNRHHSVPRHFQRR